MWERSGTERVSILMRPGRGWDTLRLPPRQDKKESRGIRYFGLCPQHGVEDLIKFGIMEKITLGIGTKGFWGAMMACLTLGMAGGCGKGTRVVESPVVCEVPDTVYRPWDEVQDKDFYKIAEDKRFNVEYSDGVILIFAMNEDGETATVYGGKPNGVERLEIPGDVEHSGKILRVTNIASYAFATYFNDSIKWIAGVKEISVGEGIENFGAGCFEGAPDLKLISAPTSLKSIGYCSMSDCLGLERMALPEDSELMTIHDFAFENCGSLEEFIVPASVRHIRQGAWRNCKALPYLTVAEGNREYKSVDGVLYTISGRQLVQYPGGKKSKEYMVESGTIEIDNSAFYGNGYLEKVTMPNSLQTIQHAAFSGCSGLKEVEFNVGLKWIGNGAFEECRNLKVVRLPGNTEYTHGNEYGYDSFPEWTRVR